MKTKSKVIENVRKIIKSYGLKQKAVALQAGYSERQFSDFMNNRKILRPDDIEKLCDALDVTPNDLFGIKDKNKTV